MSNSETFSERKCALVHGAISREMAVLCGASLFISAKTGRLTVDTAQVKGATCAFLEPTLESLLLLLTPVIEKRTGLDLVPTCSFARIYKQGDVLLPHRDRPACEVSASIPLLFDSEALWPLFIRSKEADIPMLLDVGDMLIYRGCEVEHWREPFPGRYWVQVFLHYIDRAGPYFPKHIYDERPEPVIGLYEWLGQAIEHNVSGFDKANNTLGIDGD